MTIVSESDAAGHEPTVPLAPLARVGRTDGSIRVFFLEENQLCRKLLVDALAEYGFAVQGFANSASLLDALDSGVHADIIIVLDGGLSKTSGIDLLSQVRRNGVNLPVVFLTAHEGRPAFARSAIDFIDKSRGADVLARRLKCAVEAVKLPADPRPGELMVCGRLVLKTDACRAYWDGVDVELSRGEYNVVHLLVSNAGRFVTYRAVYDRMHYEGFVAEGYRANVRSAIKRIRSRFRNYDAAFAEIENYTTFGYCWRKPEGAA
jgi:two-component system response regulator ChvI